MKTSYLLLSALALLPTVALSAAETALTPAPVGLAPSNPDPAALEAAFLRALLPIDQLVRDATAELIETVVEEKPKPTVKVRIQEDRAIVLCLQAVFPVRHFLLYQSPGTHK